MDYVSVKGRRRNLAREVSTSRPGHEQCLQSLPSLRSQTEGFVAQRCNPLTLQPEQSVGQGSIPRRAHHLSVRQGVVESIRSSLLL